MELTEEDLQECINLMRTSALFRWVPDDVLRGVISRLEVQTYKQVWKIDD